MSTSDEADARASEPGQRSRASPWVRWGLVAVVVVALVARLHMLEARSPLVCVELMTVRVGRMTLYQIVTPPPAADYMLAGFYVVMHVVQRLSDSLLALRLVPALAGVACVPLAYLVLARLFDRPAALLGAALLVVSPFHVHYSQLAKPYSMVVALALLSLHFALVTLDTPGRRNVLGFASVTCLAILVHPFNVQLIASVWLFALLVYGRAALDGDEGRAALRRLAWGTAGCLLLYGPYWPSFVRTMLLDSKVGAHGSGLELERTLEGGFVLGRVLKTMIGGFFVFGQGSAAICASLLSVGAVVAWWRARAGVLLAFTLLACPFASVALLDPGKSFSIKYVSYAQPLLLGLAAFGVCEAFRALHRTTRLRRWRWPVLVAAGLFLTLPLARSTLSFLQQSYNFDGVLADLGRARFVQAALHDRHGSWEPALESYQLAWSSMVVLPSSGERSRDHVRLDRLGRDIVIAVEDLRDKVEPRGGFPGTGRRVGLSQSAAVFLLTPLPGHQRQYEQVLVHHFTGPTPPERWVQAGLGAAERVLLPSRARADEVVQRGLLALARGDTDQARADFDRAVSIDPECSEAWLRLAVLASEDGRYDDAERAAAMVGAGMPILF